MIADVMNNLQNVCHETYELDPDFLSQPGSPWQSAIKKTKIKLDLLTNIDILLMVEKGNRNGIYYALCR